MKAACVTINNKPANYVATINSTFSYELRTEEDLTRTH